MINCLGTLVAGSLNGAEDVFYGYYDYDLYQTIDSYWDGECTSFPGYNFERDCIDRAMYETAGWYGDYFFYDIPNEFSFVSNTPYLKRGTYVSSLCESTSKCAGIFSVFGVSESDTGSLRVVLDMYNHVIV